MNEKSLTLSLVKATKERLRGCVVIKHADKATIGVPDLSVSWRGATWWVEVKYLRPTGPHADLEKELKPIQRAYLGELAAATGKALLAVYLGHSLLVYRVSPSIKSIVWRDALPNPMSLTGTRRHEALAECIEFYNEQY